MWLMPAAPLASFVVLALVGARLPRWVAALVGVGSVGVSAAVAGALAVHFLISPPPDHAAIQTLWTWMAVGDFRPTVGLRLDPLSVTMVVVITGVALLIHLYSTEFMQEDEGFSRFFAYMNLFVSCMLLLVLADNLLLLYLGWEGVGLCSYLLIGFWYRDPANGRAAMKAFIVTRVGDAALAMGIFLLYTHLGTLDLQQLSERALAQWPPGAPLALAAAALLLGGAVGKSAQLPLQTWLPDAMAGPTPVSALIHAATMVTAGVYLIARMHVIFALAPAVQLAVALIGAATLLLAAVSALAQHDLKRVLAYSTMSQIGYMFVGLGVGAPSAAIFHFATHAFYKSLLFLGAGAVIAAMDDEHSIFHMGGLRTRMPLTFWTFLAGACALSALPLVTAGFYSKDAILAAAWAGPASGHWLWTAGIVGALLTAAYTFRVVLIVFFGPVQREPVTHPGWRMSLPLVVLATLALVAGLLNFPAFMGGSQWLGRFLGPVFASSPPGHGGLSAALELRLGLASAAVGLLGILLAWLAYGPFRTQAAMAVDNAPGRALRRYWLAGWGFDWVYSWLLVRPFNWLARVNRADFVDALVAAIAIGTKAAHRSLSRTQSGQVRRYVTVLALAAAIFAAFVVFR